MTSTIKVDTIKDQASTNIVNKCGTTINIGAPGDTTKVAANTIRSNALQNACGGNTISKCGTAVTVGQSGDTVSLAAGASQSGFGRSGSVDWDTGSIKTGTFTASNGNGYFIDTSSNIVTCNLAAATVGDIVSLADYASTWATYNVTLVPNGTDKIGGTSANATLETSGQSVTLVYVDTTRGWVTVLDSTAALEGGAFICASVSGACNTLVTVQTNYKVATFLNPGTFCVSSGGGGKANVDYMVIAGGGGGGGGIGGGGAAGGYRESHTVPVSGPYTASPLAAACGAIPLSPGPYAVVVGSGGAGTGSPGVSFQPDIPGVPVSTQGGLSSFSTITSAGGGYGRHYGSQPSPTLGGPGGSGGGGSGNVGGNGGPGNQPPVSPPQGNDGGNGNPANPWGSGGGGGAASAGSNWGPGGSGNGGGATPTEITNAAVGRAGGGGGGGSGYGYPSGGSGGTGGGTGGPGSNSTGATTGTANTGGGGGGGQQCSVQRGGANGGSGIVVIRYKFQ